MPSPRLALLGLTFVAAIAISSATSVPPSMHLRAATPPGTAQLMVFGGRSAQQLAGTDAKLDAALADLVRKVGDLYDPIAEDKHVALRVTSAGNATAYCDRDLLFEAVANLVDNAVKFTPAGGRIDLSLASGENENIIRVSDTGQGIGEDERDVVMRRFYRSDKSRNTHGAGLGLSLVSAIIKLHSFRLTLNTGAGCVAEIACPAPSN